MSVTTALSRINKQDFARAIALTVHILCYIFKARVSSTFYRIKKLLAIIIY